MAEKTYAAPVVDPTTKPFWDAARQGRLMLGLCQDTGRHFWYPRGVSPFTLSTNVALVPASGTGSIYTFTIMRGAAPFCAAYVELDEGPRMFTNIVDCDLAEIRIGMRVRVVFKPTEGDGPPVPVFAPA
jgi:uncharacterized OB-fold protein